MSKRVHGAAGYLTPSASRRRCLNLYAIFMLRLGYSDSVNLRAFAGRSRRWTGYAWSVLRRPPARPRAWRCARSSTGQHRDGLLARRRHRRAAIQPRACDRDVGALRRRVRLLLRSAAVHVRGRRHAVSRHLRHHAGRGAGHFRARRSVVRAAAALESAETERMRSALLASISHDLRTPLAVISGRHRASSSAASA